MLFSYYFVFIVGAFTTCTLSAKISTSSEKGCKNFGIFLHAAGSIKQNAPHSSDSLSAYVQHNVEVVSSASQSLIGGFILVDISQYAL